MKRVLEILLLLSWMSSVLKFYLPGMERKHWSFSRGGLTKYLWSFWT